MDHQHGDGLARASVESLIRELDTGMRDIERGGRTYRCKVDSPIGITGMNLAIVKTLMNHMNKLQDRIETLEGQIQNMQRDQRIKPECEEATSPVKKAKTSPVATAGAEHGEPDHKTVSTQKELSRLWQCL
jgi:TolA-binding protein